MLISKIYKYSRCTTIRPFILYSPDLVIINLDPQIKFIKQLFKLLFNHNCLMKDTPAYTDITYILSNLNIISNNIYKKIRRKLNTFLSTSFLSYHICLFLLFLIYFHYEQSRPN